VTFSQHPFSRHELSVTLAPLVSEPGGEGIKRTLNDIAATRLRWVQIPATMNGLRPRDLDATARRDLLASLRRREIALSGIDAWIPSGHFADPAHVDRAVTAMSEIIELAGDLGRVPVSVTLTRDDSGKDAVAAVASAAIRCGVPIADHAVESPPIEGVGVGIDPAACLALNRDPASAVHAAGFGRIVSARVCDLQSTGLRGPIGAAGQSRLDVIAYRVALDVNGYRRPVVIDARQWSDPWSGVERTLAAWK
jgi:sugar phosphate isomerase/epimerase